MSGTRRTIDVTWIYLIDITEILLKVAVNIITLTPQIGHKSYEAGGYDSPSINISFLNYRYMSFRLILFHFHGTFNYFLLHKCEVSIKFNKGKQYCTVIKVYHKRSV